MLPFFLRQALDWWAAAESLRARGVPDWDPALTVWREAAWCHLLFAAGRHGAIIDRLRVVVREVTGVDPTEDLRAAGALFDKLRSAVSERYPGLFGLPPCVLPSRSP
jgi:hypothetical protein